MRDIPDERMTEQPTGVVNHPAWQIGHLTVVLDSAGKILGQEAVKGDEDGQKYGFGSQPLPDRGQYPSKDEMMADLLAAQERVKAGLEAATAEALGSANPNESMKDILPTLGDMVTFMATGHYGMHLGQVAAWRRAAGLPGVV
jgi:hypothetical protein